MRHARSFILLGAMLVLVGCATQANYERVVQSWLGASESDLVRAWGVPDQTFPLPNGDRFLVYQHASTFVQPMVISPGMTTEYASGGTYDVMASPTTISGGNPVTIFCRTEFEVDRAGRIVGWRSQGNDCKSRSPEKNPRYRAS